jgi:hypothetical protein
MPRERIIVGIDEGVVLYLQRKVGQGKPVQVMVRVLSDGTPEIWVTKEDAKEGIIHTWRGGPPCTSVCV